MSEIDQIIQKYIQGQSSEIENQQLQQWIGESSENKKRLFAEKDIWDTYGFQMNSKKYEFKPELEILKQKIEPISRKKTFSLKKAIQIAAILLITFGLGWASQFITEFDKPENVQLNFQEITVPKGQINQIFLADGTRIWINSGSKLNAPTVFAKNERLVKLNGEAFFEVAKDRSRPFMVEVNGQLIKVLGTSFNVRAYDNSNVIETTLETGQIQLKVGDQKRMLEPGEQSLFDKDKNQLVVNKVDPVNFSSWKYGRYEFQNEDLIEVFKIVERWYDVEITYNESLFRGMHFSGVIKRNKDPEHFLQLLNLTVPISYETHGDKIKLSVKKPN